MSNNNVEYLSLDCVVWKVEVSLYVAPALGVVSLLIFFSNFAGIQDVSFFLPQASLLLRLSLCFFKSLLFPRLLFPTSNPGEP